MNKSTRFLCIFMSILIMLTYFSTPMKVSAYGDQNTELLSNYLAASIELELALEEIGLKISDFEFLKDVDPQLLDDVIILAKEKYGEENFIDVDYSRSTRSAISTDVKNFSDRLLYSMHIAEVNKKTDRNAKSLEDETIYMYLSHYIDTSSPYSSPTLDYYSYDGYFSAYITDSDRTIYVQYLERTSFGRNLNDVRSAVTSLKAVQLSLPSPENFQNIAANVDRIKTSVKLVTDGFGLAINAPTSVGSIGKIISINDNAETILQAIDNDMNLEGYDTEIIMSTVGISLSIIAGVAGFGFAGVAWGFGIFTINIISMLYKDFYDYVAWLGMYSTNSARRADRYMRYIGWL